MRTLPSLLEIVILLRLPMDSGSRYAARAIITYIIVMIGIFAAFQTIGMGWSKVQWLAAAFSVGLGFGLQEIFANFVSGLIILFEQPIRVGDTVTVGNTSGRVAKIRIRATTIVDFDRKELIVPNKQFVTGELINWTLTDPSLRLTIFVGVAYGSDVDKVYATLLRLANEHPIVLKDPPPQVVFAAFGDSSLNFELRVILPHIDHLVRTRDALNRAIDKAFREQGIEISFPQRDLHLRSIDPAIAERMFEKAQGIARPQAGQDRATTTNTSTAPSAPALPPAADPGPPAPPAP